MYGQDYMKLMHRSTYERLIISVLQLPHISLENGSALFTVCFKWQESKKCYNSFKVSK